MGSVLKLDFDWRPPEEWIVRKKALIQEWFADVWPDVKSFEVVKSNSRGFHMLVYLDGELSDELICCFQWLFGDDQTRARLNYERVKAGVVHWNKLFVRKVVKK